MVLKVRGGKNVILFFPHRKTSIREVKVFSFNIAKKTDVYEGNGNVKGSVRRRGGGSAAVRSLQLRFPREFHDILFTLQ